MSRENHLDTSVPAKRSARLGWIIAGSLGLAVIGVGAVQAQRAPGFDGPGYGSPRAGDQDGWRGERQGGRRMGREDRMRRFCARDMSRYEPAARLFVKADLRLNKDQETAFDSLADTVLPALKDIKQTVCANAATPNATAPERLQHRAAVLAKMSDAAQKAIDPTNKFYALLDDTQKARFEQLFAHHRGLRVLFGRGEMAEGPRGEHQGRWGGHWRGRWNGGQEQGDHDQQEPQQQ